MVYCGKPSKGCSNCRERKVRCDQKEPTCGQCEKRQQQCPGYRNMVDLMFRDESHHVIKKANKKPRSRSTKPKPGGPTAPPPVSRDRDPGLLPGSASGHGAAPTPLSSSLLAVLDLTGTGSGTGSVSGSGSGSGSGSVDDCASEDLGEEEDDRRPRLSPRQDQQQQQQPQHHHQLLPHHPRHADQEHQCSPLDAQLASNALLPTPLQERGTAFFFSRYVATDNGCYQNYGFIYDVWKPPLSDDAAAQPDCVTASMTAVGLAGLSKLTRCAETMRRARQSYVAALQLANAALRDPVEAVKDSTMLAVLVLGTYEFISGRTPQTLEDWQKHVKGASALASMRGTAQFASRAGARMFLMLCHSVLISCIQSDLPMPRAMVDLRNELRKQRGGVPGPSWRVVDPIYRALQIRHDIKSGVITDRDEIVRQLSEVEDEFAAMVDGLPGQWKYRRAQLTRPHPGVMGRSCHIYSNLAQATTWNGMRTMRMLLQEAILEQLCADGDSPLSLPLQHQAILAKAMRMLDILGQAVVASVPQHFGIVTTRDISNNGQGDLAVSVPAKKHQYQVLTSPITQPPSPNFDSPATTPRTERGPSILDPTQSQSGPDCDAERFMTLATASNTIVWPLYTLGMSSSCSPETKDYIMDRLNAVYEETGLEQARVVAGMLQGKAESHLWDTIPRSRLPQLPDDELPAMV